MPLMNTSQKTPTVGGFFDPYPDAVTYWPAYWLGVRAPFPPDQVQNGSFENNFNDAFSEGTYQASLRVLPAGLILGAALGALGAYYYLRRR